MRPANFGVNIYYLFKIALICTFILGTGVVCNGQNTEDYDEVPVFFNIQRIGNTELPALIKDEMAYLPVIDLFEFLKINIVSKELDAVSGTFIKPDDGFLIDAPNNRIIYKDKTYDLKSNSIVKTSNNVYVRSEYFGEIFGLKCTFNFRNLSVLLNTDVELPVLREMRQEQMRNNINKLKGIFKADTLVARKRPAFYFGTADYSFATSGGNEETPRDTRASLGLGGMIAGGETNVVLNYQSNYRFSNRQQYYLWRYVDNSLSFAKQFSVGKIRGQSISSIYAPIVGVQVTNTPTTYRRSFGNYVLNNYTEPNWTVELYVNGVLVNYTKADASGFYTFNVPLVYGNTNIKLRLYGPFGEERTTEQNISIPFNFLPEKEFEYTASGGLVEDGRDTRFARFSSNYGLNRHITVGAGFEYLSSVTSGSKIPYVNTSFRLLNNLMISAEYDFDVRARSVLSYNMKSGLQFEMYNNWYRKGQTAINNTFLQEHKAILSFPVRGRHFSAYTRLSFLQIQLPNLTYQTVEWMQSAVVGTVNGSANTFALFIPGNDAYIYTIYSLGTRFFKNLFVTQQLQYEYTNKTVIAIKTSLEKRIFANGYANLSFERNYLSHVDNIEFGLRYDFSFARANTTVRKTNDTYRSLQAVSGSMIHDGISGRAEFNNYTGIGKGSVLLIPYLDLNGNNKRDKGEPKADGLKVVANAGRVKKSAKDKTILIMDLEAYATINIELDPSGFEHVGWKLLKKNYAIVIDPNYVKNIEVPVSVFGEVAGQVIKVADDFQKGLGGIIISIYNDKSQKIAETKSEADGYFSYLGLLPGKYTARIDTEKLTEMEMSVNKTSFDFTIKRSNDGSFIDGLNFVVKPVR